MIIFKILLIILVALPVLVISGIWFFQIREYVHVMNERDEAKLRAEVRSSGGGRK